MSISIEAVFDGRGNTCTCTGCGKSPIRAFMLVENKAEYDKRLADAVKAASTDEQHAFIMEMHMGRMDFSVQLCERCLEIVAGGLALMCPSRHKPKRAKRSAK